MKSKIDAASRQTPGEPLILADLSQATALTLAQLRMHFEAKRFRSSPLLKPRKKPLSASVAKRDER